MNRVVSSGFVIALLCFHNMAQAAGGALEFADTMAAIQLAADKESDLLSRGGSLDARWQGNRLIYRPNADRHDIELVNAEKNTQRLLVKHQQLMRAFQSVDKNPDNCELLTLEKDSTLRYLCGKKLASYDFQKGVVRLSSKQGAMEFRRRPQLIDDQFPTTFGPLLEVESPDGRSFITVLEHNLYLRSANDGTLRQLTYDGHLHETWLNTQESAQQFNVFWSPDSKTAATVQLDTRQVPHEPVPHLLENPPRIQPVAYPRAGEPMHRFRLFFIDVQTGERQLIETGDTENHYVDIIGWQGDGQGLLVQVLDREHKRRRILRADLSSGDVSVLLDDKTDTYHDSWMTLFIDFVHPLKNSNGFLYLSEASGWRHIEHYDGAGKLLASLTSGEWAVDRIVHIDESRGLVYFLAAAEQVNPYNLQLYRVFLQGDGRPELLSSGEGRVDVRMSPTGDYFVVRTSSPTVPPKVELRNSNGKLLKELSRYDQSALLQAGFGGMETYAVPDTTGDWTQYITIIKPYGFDPERSYPVIEYIYGGMQFPITKHQFYGFGDKGVVSSVTRSLLHSGYVVVLVDAPGTPGRGRAFQDVLYGKWPQGLILNHVAAITSAGESRPWMDLDRIGIYGHSWGAYMAQRAMIDAPGFYRAAVAHNGGSDFYDQPTYIEPFMGLPGNNPDGYAAGSNLTRVNKIRGPILNFTSPFDVNAGYSPAFKLVDAMMAASKEVELFVSPRSNHAFACCNPHQELFKLGKILQFFDREVRGEHTSSNEERGTNSP